MVLIPSSVVHSTGTGSDGSLHDVVASTVFDLDATKSGSYGGSGTIWANIVTSPADGSVQSAYDFYTGDGATSTTYPAFTGSAGAASAYWAHDGGDYFTLKSGTNTAFLKALGKTTGGTDWWIAVAGQLVTTAATNTLFSTQNTSANKGITLSCHSEEAFYLVQRGDSAAPNVFSEMRDFQSGFDFLVVYTYNHNTGAVRQWVNGILQEDVTSLTFNATSSDPSSVAHIGTRNADTLANGYRLYAVSGGNAYIDSTDEAAIRDAYQTRHSRTLYTLPDQTALADAVSGTGIVAQFETALYKSTWYNHNIPSGSGGKWLEAAGATSYDLSAVSNPPIVGWGAGNAIPYMDPASGDYWAVAANTQFIKDMHKTTGGSDFWFMMIFNSDGSFSAMQLLGTTSQATSTIAAGEIGLTIRTSTSENMTAAQAGASSTSNATLAANASFTTPGWYLVIASYSHSNNNWRVWINSATSANVAQTFATTTDDPDEVLTLHAEPDATGNSSNNLDYRSFYLGNTYLDDAKAAQIISYVEALHNTDYTP